MLKSWSYVPKWIDRAEWAEVIEVALKGSDPGPRRPGPKSRPPKADPKLQKRAEGIRALRARLSADLALDPGFLLPSQLAARVARTAPADRDGLRSVPGMTSWRVEVFGTQILDVLHQEERAP